MKIELTGKVDEVSIADHIRELAKVKGVTFDEAANMMFAFGVHRWHATYNYEKKRKKGGGKRPAKKAKKAKKAAPKKAKRSAKKAAPKKAAKAKAPTIRKAATKPAEAPARAPAPAATGTAAVLD